MAWQSRLVQMWWLALLFLFHRLPTAAAGTLQSDVAGLQGLMQAWKPPQGLAGNWSLTSATDPCDSHWDGVSCFRDSVISLRLNNFGIVGTLPSAIRNFVNLQFLDLSGNPHLGGPIPEEIGNLASLVELDLSNCNFSGGIPAHMSNLANVKLMDLSNNSLSGPPPVSLLNLPGLVKLNLSFNHFNGTLYGNVTRSVKVRVSLDYNNISGATNFPSAVLNATLGGNPVCDNELFPVPELCGFSMGIAGPSTWIQPVVCQGVCQQNQTANPATCICSYPMICNMYMGWTPASSLSASGFGHLQRQLALQLRLKSDQVWIETATFKDSSETLILVELLLFPPPSSEFWETAQISSIQTQLQNKNITLPGFEPFGLLSATVRSPSSFHVARRKDSHHHSSLAKILGAVAAVVAAVVAIIGILCLLACWKRKRTPKPPSHDHASELFGLHQQQPSILIAYDDLKAATRNFHRNNKVGEGAFGAVYKGTLRDGCEVAIKQLSSKSRHGAQEFLNEVQLISSVQHRNLVKLRGCSLSGNNRLLVYEYLENKSLAQALFDPFRRIKLDWPTRFNIVLGTARGLAYLHAKSQTRLVHRDIKATNILLDKNLEPKIADFGLAKLFQTDMIKVHTRISGKRGYIAPEYALHGQLTSKADVFSFGILALEIVSGRTNMNPKLPKEQQYLLSWAWELYEDERILELIDPNLKDTCDERQALILIHVGLLCSEEAPASRPNMIRVVAMLSEETELPEVPIRPAFLAMGIAGGTSISSSRASSTTTITYN